MQNQTRTPQEPQPQAQQHQQQQQAQQKPQAQKHTIADQLKEARLAYNNDTNTKHKSRNPFKRFIDKIRGQRSNKSTSGVNKLPQANKESGSQRLAAQEADPDQLCREMSAAVNKLINAKSEGLQSSAVKDALKEVRNLIDKVNNVYVNSNQEDTKKCNRLAYAYGLGKTAINDLQAERSEKRRADADHDTPRQSGPK